MEVQAVRRGGCVGGPDAFQRADVFINDLVRVNAGLAGIRRVEKPIQIRTTVRFLGDRLNVKYSQTK